MLGLGRRLRRTFGISAPRNQLSWRWKLPALLALLVVIGGMWWWSFDFDQLLGGFNRSEGRARLEGLESEALRLRAENDTLRQRQTELESDLNMALGAKASLSQQALDLQGENTQIKEDLAFLQRLFADTGKEGTFAIQRLIAEREGDRAYHFSVLLVRGGNPGDEFSGRLALQADLVSDGHAISLSLPEDDVGMEAALALRFKHYQRVEGSFRVPAGSQLKALQARVLEVGQSVPIAARSLTFP